jgi:pyroglutamyl-peptidase
VTEPILLTGFQPFGGHGVNPTALLMERLSGMAGIVTAVLPVEYGTCSEAFAALVRRHRPVAAICFGLSADSDAIRIERIAGNRDETARPDNAGVVRDGLAIVEDGPVRYGSTLPVPTLMRALTAAGLPVAASDCAGGYVCNHLFYRARHLIETQALDLPLGFVHMPPLPEQLAGAPGRQGLPLDRQELAARIMVVALGRWLQVPGR